ncbi:hypothetical protein AB0C76_29915 [Kitasatospora sp. NPDC048722]|uniref:hypothetical protein n=1 Tax=Kitasatospora sp. NPDC048722 TaxID=3155639 RepID=UPI0033F32A68
MEQILRRAGDVLGTGLTDPVDLGGSSRSVVLRCRTAAGGSVIVKAFKGGDEAVRHFASEAAGLSLGLGGPELLAVDPIVPLLVMADLGGAPTLADVLLGDDPKAAEEGLSAWARGLGRLGAGSVHRRAEFDRLVAGSTPGVPPAEPWIRRTTTELPGQLERAGIGAPTELAGELARIGTAGGEEFPAFTPGDTCPDNNLLTPDGLRLIDFEAACYQSVFLTAAYCRMPFSTCWCVFRLPPGRAQAIEEAYRSEIVAAYPALAEDAVWQAGMQQAIAAWTVYTTVWLVPRTTENKPLHPTRRPSPTARQVLRHRWEMARGLTDFPALAETAGLLLRQTAGEWDDEPLPGYPAFAGGRAS